MFWDVKTCEGGREEEEEGREGGRWWWVLLDFRPFGSLLVFNFSYLLLFVVPLKHCYMLPTYYFGAIGPKSCVN